MARQENHLRQKLRPFCLRAADRYRPVSFVVSCYLPLWVVGEPSMNDPLLLCGPGIDTLASAFTFTFVVNLGKTCLVLRGYNQWLKLGTIIYTLCKLAP